MPIFTSICVRDLHGLRFRVSAGLLALLLLPAALPGQTYRYTVTDLGIFSPLAVNNLGHVAGTVTGTTSYAVFYKDGVLIPLGTFGGASSGASGLNNRDEIVGSAQIASGANHPFLYSGSSQTMTDLTSKLGTLPASRINDAGNIMGYNNTKAFIYANGVINTIPSSVSLNALALNNRDEVTGMANVMPVYQAFFYSGGVIKYIGAEITAVDLNEREEIVGSENTLPYTTSHYYYNGVMSALPNLPSTGSFAQSINNFGMIVGNSTGSSGGHAALWQNGTVTDLNTLVDLSASNFSILTSAVSISDTGYIVGRGTTTAGETHAFLLTPIQPPLPAWWTARGVLDPTKAPVDYAVANQGQVKSIAAKAYDELQARLSGGAGPALTALIAGWSNPTGASDYAAINQGQLKTIAKLFYDRLAEVGYQGPPLAAGQTYPWPTSTTFTRDYVAANIGQVKYLFSFTP